MNEMNVETVRTILERTFGVPIAESDAQIVLDNLNAIRAKEQAEQSAELLRRCPKCNAVAGQHHEKREYYSPLCPECQCELHLTTAGEHVCRNETCKMYR